MGTSTIKEQSAVSVTPPAPGSHRVFVDSADQIIKTKDSFNVVRPFGVGTASELDTTGAPVNVDASAPPNAGDVLTATSPTLAIWAPPAPVGFTVTAVQTGPTYAAAVGELVLVDVSGGAVQVNLPAGHAAGEQIGVKMVTTAANNITIDANGAETIDTALTLVLVTGFEWAILVSDGANWSQIG